MDEHKMSVRCKNNRKCEQYYEPCEKTTRMLMTAENMTAITPTSSENKSKPPAIEKIFLKSDIHGLPEWYLAKTRSNKICWTIILIVAAVLLVYGLIKTIMDFNDNPILTTHSVVSEPGGTEFPDIYICPLTPVHEGQRLLSNVDQAWESEKQVSEYFKASTALYGNDGKSSILQTKIKLWDQISSRVQSMSAPLERESDYPEYQDYSSPWVPRDIEDYFMTVGYSTETLFKECSFNSEYLDCDSIITPFFDRDYGKCFSLHTDLHQLLPGIGLSLVLDLDLDNAYNSENSESQPLFDGLIMKVDQRFDPGNYKKVYLKPGLNTQATLEVTKYNLIQRERISGAKQKCNDGEKARSENLKVFNVTYSLGVCNMDCVQREVIAECGCILAMDKRMFRNDILKNLPLDPFCSIETKTECVDKILERNKQNPRIRKCVEACLVPCNMWEFRTELSFLDFPSSVIENKSPYPGQQPLPTTTPSYWIDENTTTAKMIKEVMNKTKSFRQENDGKIKSLQGYLRNTSSFLQADFDFLIWQVNDVQFLNRYRSEEEASKNLLLFTTSTMDEFPRLIDEIQNQVDLNSTQLSEFTSLFSDINTFAKSLIGDFPFSFWVVVSHFQDLVQRLDQLEVNESMGEHEINSWMILRSILEEFQTKNQRIVAARLQDFWNHTFEEVFNATLTAVTDNGTISNISHIFRPGFMECCQLVFRIATNTLEGNASKFTTEKPMRRNMAQKKVDPITTFQNFRKNYIILDVSFASLRHIEITQEPSMTFDTFVSNIGGQVGLWLGASIVTMIKFFVILWPICIAKLGFHGSRT